MASAVEKTETNSMTLKAQGLASGGFFFVSVLIINLNLQNFTLDARSDNPQQ
jgi:hypothetical protein